MGDHNGTLLEFIEDEVLAVFNAPEEILDHCDKAMHAALEVHRQMEELLPGFRVRCGVHTAQVLIGNIGSPTRMKYGVLGDGVNTTARLKSLNSWFGTNCLVSDTTAQSVEDVHGTFFARPVGNVTLKGRTSATKTWEVLGLRNRVSSKQSTNSETKDETLIRGVQKHTQAYALYMERRFSEAKSVFNEAHETISSALGEEGLSLHF